MNYFHLEKLKTTLLDVFHHVSLNSLVCHHLPRSQSCDSTTMLTKNGKIQVLNYGIKKKLDLILTKKKKRNTCIHPPLC